MSTTYALLFSIAGLALYILINLNIYLLSMRITYNKNKTTKLCLLLLIASYICLVQGCDACVVSKSKLQPQKTISQTARGLSVNDASYKLLTINGMEGEGTNQFCIARVNSSLQATDPRSLQGYLAIIGLPTKHVWRDAIWKDNLAKKATNCINDGLLKIEDGIFMVCHKLDNANSQNFDIILKGLTYQKLTAEGYHMHIVAFDPTNPTKQLFHKGPMRCEKQPEPLLDANIGFQAHAVKEEKNGQIIWHLQGEIDPNYDIKNLKNDQLGFLLIENKPGVDLWNLLHKQLLTGLNNPALALDGVIMAPVNLNTTNNVITTDLTSTDSLQKKNFKLLSYIVKGNHYYISQVDHLVSNQTNKLDNRKEQISLPDIDTRNHYSLKLNKLDISLHKTAFDSTISNVTFQGFDIDFLMNGTPTTWPSDLKGCLLIQEDKEDKTHGSLPDYSSLVDLFGQLDPAKNSVISKDGKNCLISNKANTLHELSLPFFNDKKKHLFFICGFSQKSNAFEYYTQLDNSLVTITQVPQNAATWYGGRSVLDKSLQPAQTRTANITRTVSFSNRPEISLDMIRNKKSGLKSPQFDPSGPTSNGLGNLSDDELQNIKNGLNKTPERNVVRTASIGKRSGSIRIKKQRECLKPVYQKETAPSENNHENTSALDAVSGDGKSNDNETK